MKIKKNIYKNKRFKKITKMNKNCNNYLVQVMIKNKKRKKS